MVSGLRSGTYEGRLEELGLMSLEMRRTKYDMVQVFKAIHDYDQVDYTTWFKLVGEAPTRVTRGTSDPLNIVLSASQTDLRRHFFSQRVSRSWNELPSDLKRAQSVAIFKRELSAILTNTIVP